jgi:hypothetical protein
MLEKIEHKILHFLEEVKHMLQQILALITRISTALDAIAANSITPGQAQQIAAALTVVAQKAEALAGTPTGTPLAISTTVLVNATLNSPFSASILTTGGTAPLSFAVSSGSLPAGLSLDSKTGVISGTPTTAGQSSFAVTVTDSSTPTPQTATMGLALTVA